jgi:hypothetical protein
MPELDESERWGGEAATEISERELEMRKWLPSIKPVLLHSLVTQKCKENGSVFECHDIEQFFLSTLKLFGESGVSEMKALYLAKLEDPQIERAFSFSLRHPFCV